MSQSESGSGEPVPAPTSCPVHGDQCPGPFCWAGASPGGEPPTPSGSARPPLPPQVAYVIAGRCLSTQHNQEPCDCAPSGFGEPSREPTLEEIVQETLLAVAVLELRDPDEQVRRVSRHVRARLSSPEAPR